MKKYHVKYTNFRIQEDVYVLTMKSMVRKQSTRIIKRSIDLIKRLLKCFQALYTI